MVGCSVHLTLLHTDFIPGFVCSEDLLWNHDPPQIVDSTDNDSVGQKFSLSETG